MTKLTEWTPVDHCKLLFIVFSLLSVYPSIAQQPEKELISAEENIRDKIEILAASIDREIDYTELLENLLYFAENPLNLNSAGKEDLQKLFFLNDLQVYHLLAYRENYGYFVSIYELQTIEGYDRSTIENMLPFVRVAPVKESVKLKPGHVFKYGKHQAIFRFQDVPQSKKGFNEVEDSTLYQNPSAIYLGSPEKLYFRYGFNYANRIRFGVTMEKDPGEVFFASGVNDSIIQLANGKIKNGFDFYSGYVSLNDMGPVKALTIGDYQVRFGQGLTMWSGLAFGKSADAVNTKRYAQGISPYTSSDENRFLRGIASTLDLGHFDVTAFYSKNKLDAGLSGLDTIQSFDRFASLYETGYHRTVNEILKKDAIELTVAGGNINFSKGRFQMGITGFYSVFDYSLAEKPQLYNAFAFSGSENLNGGIDANLVLQKVNLFGEIAMSENGGLAQLYGLVANLLPRVSASILYRNYQKEYQNRFSNPFAESNNHNERGIYTGLRIVLAKQWLVSMYVDQFVYPWLKYGVNKPSRGNEILLQFDYRMSESVSMNFRFRGNSKQENKAGSEEFIKPVLNNRKTSFRYHIDYVVSPSVSMRDRLEYGLNKFNDGYKGAGFIIFHDIKWNPPGDRLDIYFRYALFDTDTYDERLYAYENDVLYAFSVPAYYYKGSKGIAMIKYSIGNVVNLWFRISHTWFSNQQTLGSGLDLIEGNSKSEVKVQVQVKL
ncbi:MAG: helix-hairpin-helix domain-containing protein [Bacteroidales bacterium]